MAKHKLRVVLAFVSVSLIAVPVAATIGRRLSPSEHPVAEIPRTSEPIGFRAPTAPPSSVLEPHLTQRGDDSQTGVLVHYDWVVGGTPKKYWMDEPITWPVPIALHNERLTFELGTSYQPETLEFRLYRDVEKDGTPKGHADFLSCTRPEHPLRCQRIDPSVQGRSRWLVTLLARKGDHFIVASAIWPDATKRKTHIASWLFHVRS